MLLTQIVHFSSCELHQYRSCRCRLPLTLPSFDKKRKHTISDGRCSVIYVIVRLKVIAVSGNGNNVAQNQVLGSVFGLKLLYGTIVGILLT